jgi:hypothetical protein
MECINCKIKMNTVNFGTGSYGLQPYIWYKKKGILEIEKKSSVSCYVCTKCGHIELLADEPEKFENIYNQT